MTKSTKSSKSLKSIEETFDELEDIIERMENPDLGLEDSFKLYNEGIKTLKTAKDSIDKIEKKIIILSEEGVKNEY